MPLFAPNFLFLYFVVASARGEVNLQVLKNENGIETPVSTFIEAGNGANFSLECRVLDSKHGEMLKDPTVWKKKIWKYTFTEGRDLKVLENTMVGATMTFIPVSVKNQGQYVCVSPKYNLKKIVTLKVRPEFSSFNFKARAHSLGYLNGKRRRSSESVHDSSLPMNKDPKISSNVEEFSTIDKEEASDDLDYDQWDVKKVKLNQENETEPNFVRYHDGTTDMFKIGLLVSFALLAVIGVYRIFKCWRTGTLGPIDHRGRASSATPQAQNNYQDICDSNQTTITTCPMLNESTISFESFMNGLNENGYVENSPEFMMGQTDRTSAQSHRDMDDFNARFESLAKNH